MKNKKLMAVAPFLIIGGAIGVTYGAYNGILGVKIQRSLQSIRSKVPL